MDGGDREVDGGNRGRTTWTGGRTAEPTSPERAGNYRVRVSRPSAQTVTFQVVEEE